MSTENKPGALRSKGRRMLTEATEEAWANEPNASNTRVMSIFAATAAELLDGAVEHIEKLEAQLEAVGAGGVSPLLCPGAAVAQPVALPADALAQLRHLYQNMMNEGVRDTASAKRIAEGILSPVIAAMERSITTTQAIPDGFELSPMQLSQDMNRDDVIRTAYQAGAKPGIENFADVEFLENFARMVADRKTRASLALPAAGQEPVAWRLRNTAFRSDVYEYFRTRYLAECRQRRFNASVDDGGLHDLTPLYTAPQPAVAATPAAPECYHRPPCSECAAHKAEGAKP